MTTKEKIVRLSIAEVKVKMKKLDDILNASPAIDIINIRQEFKELLEENKGDKRLTAAFSSMVNHLDKREKAAWRMVKKQEKNAQHQDEHTKLSMELRDLENELFYIERSN